MVVESSAALVFGSPFPLYKTTWPSKHAAAIGACCKGEESSQREMPCLMRASADAAVPIQLDIRPSGGWLTIR